ncbi:MAG: hypothetical protein H7101_08475 [Deinococcales bacterium]|nr:hypothetical protein [Chitinophagaceae bacterium]
MKTVLIIASFFMVTITNAQGKFEGGMAKGLGMMKEAKTAIELSENAAFFERIGDAEKTQWLPYYYAALTSYQSAWADPKADKDKIGEACKALIAKAEAIEKNADLYCLQQQVAVLQMMVDPMSRWQTYGTTAKTALDNAKKADATNPRIYFLDGITLMNTPEAFGGGKAVAKPLFAKSVELFKTYKPATVFHPNWGAEDAAKQLAACN